MKKNNPKTNNPNLITIHKNMQGAKAQESHSNNLIGSNKQIDYKKLLSEQKANKKNNKNSLSNPKAIRPISGSKNKIQNTIRDSKNSKASSKGQNGKKKHKNTPSQRSEKSVTSQKRKNIYTSSNDHKKMNKKQSHYTNKQSSKSSRSNYNIENLQSSSNTISESLTSYTQNRLQVQDLVQQINQNQFNHLQSIKIKILSFILKNRIIKDQQYDKLYEQLVDKFPEKEEVIKSVLFQIVSSLDS